MTCKQKAWWFPFLAAGAIALSGCGTSQDTVIQEPQQLPRGSLAISVVPNPIVARPAPDDNWSFPFEVIIRETGGADLRVQRVSIHVTAFGAVPVYSDTQEAEEIRSRGYPTEIAANGELRYRFSPTREVPDDRLFGGVSAELVVEAINDRGQAIAPARTNVSVTR